MKQLLCVFAVAIFATSSLADSRKTEAFCIRVYCSKDKTSKIRNEGGKIYFRAGFDKLSKKYILDNTEFSTAQGKCRIPGSGKNVQLYGQNAAKLETLGTIYEAGEASGVIIPAKECK